MAATNRKFNQISISSFWTTPPINIDVFTEPFNIGQNNHDYILIISPIKDVAIDQVS